MVTSIKSSKKLVFFALMLVGVTLFIASAFFLSAFLAIVSLAFVFWGILLTYLSPTPQISQTILNAVMETNTQYTEQLLKDQRIEQKAIYLPLISLADPNTLVFIPNDPNIPLPTAQDIAQQLVQQHKGCLITAPGSSMAVYFEQQLGRSFFTLRPEDIVKTLNHLLVDKLEIARNVDGTIKKNEIVVVVQDSKFSAICETTQQKYPQTHHQLGCLLSSALACIITKASAKPVTIKTEKYDAMAGTAEILFTLED